jgi:hypothetical protein
MAGQHPELVARPSGRLHERHQPVQMSREGRCDEKDLHGVHPLSTAATASRVSGQVQYPMW